MGKNGRILAGKRWKYKELKHDILDSNIFRFFCNLQPFSTDNDKKSVQNPRNTTFGLHLFCSRTIFFVKHLGIGTSPIIGECSGGVLASVRKCIFESRLE